MYELPTESEGQRPQPQARSAQPEAPGHAPVPGSAGERLLAGNKARTVLLLRWVLILATCCLLLFSDPLARPRPWAAAFAMAYIASNLLLLALLPHIRSQRKLETAVVLFDAVAVSVGLALTERATTDFFLLYFLVMFLGALAERFDLVLGAALLIGGLHLYTVGHSVGYGNLLESEYLLRVPFLFVVALFFGYLVENTRAAEREAQRAREHERVKSEFLAAVTHDLKSPLALIDAVAQALLDGECGPLGSNQAEYVRRIHASVRRAITLALNLLDASRIESGRWFLARTPVDLSAVIEDSVAVARSAADLKRIQLRCEVHSPLPTLEGDFMQLGRLLSNLIDNAIKYAPAGGTVAVSARVSGGAVELCVEDNGQGIPPEELPTLFDRYRRAAKTEKVEGTGLGLFLVKAIAEAHGGRVAVTSALGKGTRVSVFLPCTAGRVPLPSPPAPGALSPPALRAAPNHCRNLAVAATRH